MNLEKEKITVEEIGEIYESTIRYGENAFFYMIRDAFNLGFERGRASEKAVQA